MSGFLDTFAMIAILEGHPQYREVATGARTNLLNLYELHVQVARLADEDIAETVFRSYRHSALPIDDEDVFEASRVKLTHRAKGLSYADALGYAMARRRGLPFVTGDKAFEKLDGVRFIPAPARRR